jgi:hypothetical protein
MLLDFQLYRFITGPSLQDLFQTLDFSGMRGGPLDNTSNHSDILAKNKRYEKEDVYHT